LIAEQTIESTTWFTVLSTLGMQVHQNRTTSLYQRHATIIKRTGIERTGIERTGIESSGIERTGDFIKRHPKASAPWAIAQYNNRQQNVLKLGVLDVSAREHMNHWVKCIIFLICQQIYLQK
jgi:hypothetical protein